MTCIPSPHCGHAGRSSAPYWRPGVYNTTFPHPAPRHAVILILEQTWSLCTMTHRQNLLLFNTIPFKIEHAGRVWALTKYWLTRIVGLKYFVIDSTENRKGIVAKTKKKQSFNVRHFSAP